MEHVRIRDASGDEHAAIRDLTLAAYSQYATIMAPSAWAKLKQAVLAGLATDQPVERIVAVRGGTFIGCVMLYPPAADAYGGAAARAAAPELRLLAVAPEARGQGIGEALVAECARRARKAGAAELGLHTSDSMHAAMRMYERMGFARAPEYDFHPPGAELVKAYRLELRDAAATLADQE